MNCPYCQKHINGLTGLQELQKFNKHLRVCRKHPDRKIMVGPTGDLKKENPPSDLLNALNVRFDSGQ